MISVILPTFNEGDNIVPLIERIIKSLPMEKEIIVIDDDSPDGTSDLVADRYCNNPVVRLITRRNERGLTSAVQRGINEAAGDIIVWMDCDLSMPPEKIPELIGKIARQGFDAAVGSRYVEGGSDDRTSSGKVILFIHKTLSTLITRFTSIMLWKDFYDWTSGFIAVKSEVIKKFPLKGDYGEYFIEMIYCILKKGYKVVEVPYHLVPREHGESKTATNVFGFFKRGIKYVTKVISLKYKSK
jgi:dolichol-phosphate mannosyltransferase